MRFCLRRALQAMVAGSMLLPLAVLAQPGTLTQKTSFPNTSHTLRISSGDLLELAVFDTPELSSKVRVNEAGDITVPVAGAVRVSGMTSEEAAVAIEEKFRSTDVLKYPHVSIFITEYATQGVTVTGEVKTPGIYPLMGSHGLLDMVSAAGGVTPTAGKTVTVTHKSDPAHPEVIQLDSNPESIAENIDIRPGDTVVVSRAGVVYVVGDVGKPGGFLIQNNGRLSVLQLLALAQGTNHTAALDRTKLIRKRNETREEFQVPLKKILAGKASDVTLKDGDILFIPTSGAKVFVGGVGAATVPSVIGGMIYRGW